MLVKIYALVDPRNPMEYRYVGKTKKVKLKRLYEHIACANRGGKTYRDNWIRSLLREGVRPEQVLLEVTFTDGAVEEIGAIARCRAEGHPLTNTTIGGEGCAGMSQELRDRRVASRAWYKHSDEVKAKIGAAKEGLPLHPNTIAAMLISSRGKKNVERMTALAKSRIGTKATPETIAKLSEAQKKAWESGKRVATQEMKDRITSLNISRKGQPLSDAHKQKVGAASKKAERTPEWKANIAAAIKAHWETRRKIDKEEAHV